MFPGASHLERYSARFNATEINSSFYRSHLPKTYERWAAHVPAHFRFAVKVPKEITHVRRLVDAGELLDRFLSEIGMLGNKLGPLLVQLPRGNHFDGNVASEFFDGLRRRFDGEVVCEPRHPTWFTLEAEKMLRGAEISRVAADPACVPQAAQPGGWERLVYYRLHGSPRMYYSSYSGERLRVISQNLANAAQHGHSAWCIFDNTALGEATGNALFLSRQVRR